MSWALVSFCSTVKQVEDETNSKTQKLRQAMALMYYRIFVLHNFRMNRDANRNPRRSEPSDNFDQAIRPKLGLINLIIAAGWHSSQHLPVDIKVFSDGHYFSGS